MSIKPTYGDAILSGRKRGELRRMVHGPITPGSVVVLYFSTPRRAIEGFFKAERVYLGKRSELMSIAKSLGDLGIGEGDWDYVDEDRDNMLIIVSNPRTCRRPIPLEHLIDMIPGFKPPLSYMHVNPRSQLYWLIFDRCIKPYVAPWP